MVRTCKERRKMLNNPEFLKHVASRKMQSFQPEKAIRKRVALP